MCIRDRMLAAILLWHLTNSITKMYRLLGKIIIETTLVDAWRTPTTTVIEMVVNDTDGAQTLQQLLAQVSHL